MKLNKHKLKAFSLAEAMIAILITILCIELLMGALGVVKTANKSKEPINEMAFAYVQLERFIAEQDHLEIDAHNSTSNKLILRAKIGEEKDGKPIFKNYVIVKYRQMIRMSGSQGGHMPLLFGVRNADFDWRENFFVMNVVATDGRKSNLVFKTDLPLPETNKDTKKKSAAEKKKDDQNNGEQKQSKG